MSIRGWVTETGEEPQNDRRDEIVMEMIRDEVRRDPAFDVDAFQMWKDATCIQKIQRYQLSSQTWGIGGVLQQIHLVLLPFKAGDWWLLKRDSCSKFQHVVQSHIYRSEPESKRNQTRRDAVMTLFIGQSIVPDLVRIRPIRKSWRRLPKGRCWWWGEFQDQQIQAYRWKDGLSRFWRTAGKGIIWLRKRIWWS